tara:strand:- start:1856 stop:2173 length:318 start_codon:yes stop_codon:yes gene_type:complete
MDQFHDTKKSTKSKPTTKVGTMGETKGKEGNEQGSGPRHHVRIRSYRVRMLDIDNLYGGCKHLIDSLRIARIIPDDDPTSITLEVSQEKVKGYKSEKTEVEVKCV